jgi:hypothetical protein
MAISIFHEQWEIRRLDRYGRIIGRVLPPNYREAERSDTIRGRCDRKHIRSTSDRLVYALLVRPASQRIQGRAHRFHVGEDGIPKELQRLERAVSCFRMSSSTGVANKDRHKSEIRTMAAREVDADLRGYSDDDESLDATVSQR